MEVFRFVDVSVVMMLVICTELTVSLPRKTNTPSFKDMLYHLAWNYLVTDSFYNEIMTPSTPLSSVENICREKKTVVCWLLCIFLLSPLISIQSNIYGNIWKGIRQSMQPLVKKLYGMPLMSAGTIWSQKSSTILLNLCQSEFQQFS